MRNEAFNFSLHLGSSGPSLDDYTTAAGPELKIGSVDAHAPARDAARMARENNYQILVVRDEETPVGLFFPGYLHDLLPHHPVSDEVGIDAGMQLDEIIDRIDAADIHFHSERVNYYPNLWKCPHGHVTEDNPCPHHAVVTKPYP